MLGKILRNKFILFSLVVVCIEIAEGVPVRRARKNKRRDVGKIIGSIIKYRAFMSAEGKDDPNFYPSFDHPKCAGKAQSPIDLNVLTAKNGDFTQFTLGNYDQALSGWQVVNTGFTGVYSLAPGAVSANKIPYIKDGGLKEKYQFSQFHFHWGVKDLTLNMSEWGSEHTVKTLKFPAELHLVHFNTKYGTLAKALGHNDGLAVLGIFIKTGIIGMSSTFSKLLTLSDGITEIKDGYVAGLGGPLSLNDVMPIQTSSFFRYDGSLTTPTCDEVVKWTVFDTPILISQDQLDKLRNLFGPVGKKANFRPVQPLNGRDVFYRTIFGGRR